MSIGPIGGLASGLDTEAIIESLMKTHQSPLTKIKQNKQILLWKQESYREINTSLLNLRNQIFDMTISSAYLTKKATSSNENIIKIKAENNASLSSYQIKVIQLANVATNASLSAIANDSFDASQSIKSQQDNFINSSEADFGFDADNVFSFEINGEFFSFDADTTSLNDIIGAINNNKNAGVSAFYDSYTKKTSLTTLETGNNNVSGNEISFSGNFLTNILNLDESNEIGGQNAILEINGIKDIQKTSNVFEINGATFEIMGTTTNGYDGAYTQITIEQDVEEIIQKIKDTVNKYNETITKMNNLISETRPKDNNENYYLPLTEEEKENLSEKQLDKWEEKAKTGLLRNDTLVSSGIYELRSIFGSVVMGLSEEITVNDTSTIANNLTKIGINTGHWSEMGQLHVDESTLREALTSNPNAVVDLLTKSSSNKDEQGVFVKAYNGIVETMSKITTKAGNSSNSIDDSFIGKELKDIDSQIITYEERLEKIQNRYWSQFTAMEKALDRMNSQSAWLMQFLNQNK